PFFARRAHDRCQGRSEALRASPWRPTPRNPRPESGRMNRFHCLTLIAGALTLVSSSVRAQDLTFKAAPQQHPVVITNAAIHTVSGQTFHNGYVIFDKGKITAVGDAAALPHLATDVQTIDAKGKHVYPGLIGAYTQLGLTEIGQVRASQDMSEVGSDGLTP